MLRRLHPEQPESFAFTEANQAWAEGQISKYPEGRQASAIIPLLWRAQEQEGWLSRAAIEHVADMLDLAHIRALEVATFYFMFQLQPVGSVAHIQICGTTSCMICGAEDLMAVCKDKIAPEPHALSADGKFSWEEVECLGACANAPMAQIGKDYYEDLTAERLGEIIEALGRGEVPVPGPQNGRFAAEPIGGVTSLVDYVEGRPEHNASATLAVELGDTVKRIDGTEVPLLTPWREGGTGHPQEVREEASGQTADSGLTRDVVAEETVARPEAVPPRETDIGASDRGPAGGGHAQNSDGADRGPGGAAAEAEPLRLEAARAGGADDLTRISGVGPKLEAVLNDLGFYHFDQIAAWTGREIAWVDSRLQFKGRIERDSWVAQAAELAGE